MPIQYRRISIVRCEDCVYGRCSATTCGKKGFQLGSQECTTVEKFIYIYIS